MISFFDLPIYQHKDTILDALKTNQAIIVESPTGSGKTTQIPLILKEAGYDKEGVIGITQPRRIATLSVCEFIKKQINDTGSYCAYTMRFSDTSTPETRVKIMTDGILLQEVKADPILSRYSVIMVDEAHERSLNIDFILGLLKEISEERKDLKLIISSATINTQVFSTFFSNAPIISISGRPYPVEVRYVPILLSRDTEDIYFEKVLSIIQQAHDSKTGGDVLVFLPGEGEIKDCLESLHLSPLSRDLQIYPLYGRLSKEEQERVFLPTEEGKTKVVVATNIAETSLTIDGIRTVIDSGMAKVNLYNQQNFTSALVPMQISKASADQRKGRAGRTASGVCYRMYSQKSYETRPVFSEEEILHSDLAEVVLRMSELEIYNTSTFPFITPPKKAALRSAEETLIEIGAIEPNHHLTSIGQMMIKFPLLPRLSRVIVEAILNYPEVISDVITAVAFLSTKTPYVLPPGEELTARDVHHAMGDKVYGDFVAMLTLYRKYRGIDDKKERESFCKSHFLDMQTMDEIVHIKYQLEEIVAKEGIPIQEGGSVASYFCCLASGLRQFVCKRVDRYSFRTITADRIMIHPGSAWFRNMPEYILAGEIVQTTKMYARTVSPLRSEWLERIDPLILKALNQRAIARRNMQRTRKDGLNELERFKTKLHGKEVYLVPIDKLSTIQNRSDARIFIQIDKHHSHSSFRTKELDTSLRLLGEKLIFRKPKGYASIEKGEFALIDKYLAIMLRPFVAGGNEFAFLALKESKEKRYALVPVKSLDSAIKDSMYALSSLLDDLPPSQKKLRARIAKKLKEIEHTLELDKS